MEYESVIYPGVVFHSEYLYCIYFNIYRIRRTKYVAHYKTLIVRSNNNIIYFDDVAYNHTDYEIIF